VFPFTARMMVQRQRGGEQ